MPGQGNSQDALDAAQIAALVRKLVDVPNELVTAQLRLRSLSSNNPLDLLEAKQTIADACDHLQSAIADLTDAVHNLAELSALDAKRSTSIHVGTDTYYGAAP